MATFPKKGEHRQRAVRYPTLQSANHVNWSVHYPKYFPEHLAEANDAGPIAVNTYEYPIEYSTTELSNELCGNGVHRKIDILDVGCGFGAMTIRLAELYPDMLVLGLEIREKVATFVAKRIHALRTEALTQQQPPALTQQQPPPPVDYQNCSVIRTNAMKFLPNYIRKWSVKKMFFLYPDPHFKKPNWQRRIITPQLLSTYAYHLIPDEGKLYFATDVYDLYQWMKLSCDTHPLFEPVENVEEDPAYLAMFNTTDECKKAIRLNQKLYGAVYRRIRPSKNDVCAASGSKNDVCAASGSKNDVCASITSSPSE